MVKPRLNQTILASFRRKKVKLGQFLKGEDNMPIFHVEVLCYKLWCGSSFASAVVLQVFC